MEMMDQQRRLLLRISSALRVAKSVLLEKEASIQRLKRVIKEQEGYPQGYNPTPGPRPLPWSREYLGQWTEDEDS